MKKFLKLNLPLAFVGLFAFSSALLAEHHGHSDLRDYGAETEASRRGRKTFQEGCLGEVDGRRPQEKEEHHEKGDRHGKHDKKDWGHRGHGDKDRHEGR